MKFSEYLIQESDLTQGMAKTRQAIGRQGPVTKAATAIEKGAAGTRLTGTETEAASADMETLKMILSDPQLNVQYKKLAAIAKKRAAGTVAAQNIARETSVAR